MLEGSDVAVVAAGPMAYRALEAAMELRESMEWYPSIYNIRYIKPVDQEMLAEIAAKFRTVITVEDGTVLGGLHGAVAEFMSEQDEPLVVVPVGIPDVYVSQGTQDELRDECGLSVARLAHKIMQEKQKIDKKNKKVLEN